MFRFFENLVDPFSKTPSAQPPDTLLAFLWHYSRPFFGVLVLTIFTAIISAFIEVYAFNQVGTIIDWMTNTPPAEFWAQYGQRMIVIGVLVAIVWPLISLLDDLATFQGLRANLSMHVRWLGHQYLLRQSTTFFANDFAGRISTKLMQTAMGVRQTVDTTLNLFVYIGVYFSSAVVLFAANDVRLTIPILIWLIAYGATMVYFLPRLLVQSEKINNSRSALTGRMVDAYTNIQTVKLFASHQAEEKYAHEGMQDMMSTIRPQMRLVTMMSVTLHTINGFLIAGTMGMGALLWSENLLSIGAVAFAGAMVLRLQGLSHYFLWEMANLFENIGAVQDGMKTLSKPIAVVDTPNAAPLQPQNGQVVFDHVAFHYGSERSIIRDLNLVISPGEKVGIVGRSGAGKSTLVNLLLRLHDAEGGSITIDGQDIKSVTQDSLRAAIAVVTQDTALLHRSIRENIAYGRANASEDDIINAAKRAEAWEFIETLEDQNGRTGLNAQVGERGVKLSGGQRQRIAIARVILKDAPILVLDEATSALDSEVEAAIQGRLNMLMKNKTVIAIAHRLSTIAAMDRLIVLEEGQIVEQGSHDELLALGGIYAGLWARQSGGFLISQEANAEENA